MSSKLTLLRCEILDKDLALRYESSIVSFDAVRAHRLESKGVVRILPKEEVISVGQGARNPALLSAFSEVRSVKVAWVQDQSKEGGAELSNKTVIAIGQSLGYDIALVTPDRSNRQVLLQADLIIVNNIFEFSPEQMNDIRFCIYERRIPYVKYDHDYRELARTNLSQQLFFLSRANVFISPAHKERSYKVLGIDDRAIVLPLAIDTTLFHPIENACRVPGSVLIPCYRKGKEPTAEFIKKNPQFTYTIIGQCDRSFPDGKISHVGAGPIGQMPMLYSTHEFMLHLPEEHWAGERIYFESILCGCKPLINEETVGHASWKFPVESIRNELEKAPFTFWREICQLLSN